MQAEVSEARVWGVMSCWNKTVCVKEQLTVEITYMQRQKYSQNIFVGLF